MQPTDTDPGFNSLYLRHDLMIELGRLESVIENSRNSSAAIEPGPTNPIADRHAQISGLLR
jgi:hypothetical protein